MNPGNNPGSAAQPHKPQNPGVEEPGDDDDDDDGGDDSQWQPPRVDWPRWRNWHRHGRWDGGGGWYRPRWHWPEGSWGGRGGNWGGMG